MVGAGAELSGATDGAAAAAVPVPTLDLGLGRGAALLEPRVNTVQHADLQGV